MGAIIGYMFVRVDGLGLYEVVYYGFGIRLHSMYVRVGSMGNVQKKPFS
jgi:hypothetical protein